MSTRYNNGSHYENHQRAAELHDGAAHAHRSAAEQRGKQDHLTGQEQSRQALEHSIGHQPQLQAGQLIPQTEMGAEAKSHVVIGVSPDVELVGVLEHRLVEVRRLEKQHDLLALPKLGAVKLGVGGQHSAHVLHR